MSLEVLSPHYATIVNDRSFSNRSRQLPGRQQQPTTYDSEIAADLLDRYRQLQQAANVNNSSNSLQKRDIVAQALREYWRNEIVVARDLLARLRGGSIPYFIAANHNNNLVVYADRGRKRFEIVEQTPNRFEVVQHSPEGSFVLSAIFPSSLDAITDVVERNRLRPFLSDRSSATTILPKNARATALIQLAPIFDLSGVKDLMTTISKLNNASAIDDSVVIQPHHYIANGSIRPLRQLLQQRALEQPKSYYFYRMKDFTSQSGDEIVLVVNLGDSEGNQLLRRNRVVFAVQNRRGENGARLVGDPPLLQGDRRFESWQDAISSVVKQFGLRPLRLDRADRHFISQLKTAQPEVDIPFSPPITLREYKTTVDALNDL